VFKLSEEALASAVERYAARNGSVVRLSAPAGALQLAFDGDPGELALKVLEVFLSERAGASVRLGGGAEDSELAELDKRLPVIRDVLDRLEVTSRREQLIAEGAGRR
jgi:hypothetical protein